MVQQQPLQRPPCGDYRGGERRRREHQLARQRRGLGIPREAVRGHLPAQPRAEKRPDLHGRRARQPHQAQLLHGHRLPGQLSRGEIRVAGWRGEQASARHRAGGCQTAGRHGAPLGAGKPVRRQHVADDCRCAHGYVLPVGQGSRERPRPHHQHDQQRRQGWARHRLDFLR